MFLMFHIICTFMKMKEQQNHEIFDYFNENEMVEVTRKIFNDNCAENTS